MLAQRSVWAAVGFALLATVAAQAAPAPSRAVDVPALIVTYRAAPGARLALRNALSERDEQRWNAWKRGGVLANYRLLFSRYVNSDGWDAMAVLSFTNEAALTKWKSIETSTPAGLSPETLKLVADVTTTPVDEVRENRDAEPARSGVYIAIPYTYTVSRPEYVDYLDHYVIPQFDGWIGEHAVSQYEILLARFPAGRSWASMILVEYRDDAALATRDAVTAKVRRRLSADPQWKAISDSKKNVRTEGALTVADELPITAVR